MKKKKLNNMQTLAYEINVSANIMLFKLLKNIKYRFFIKFFGKSPTHCS